MLLHQRLQLRVVVLDAAEARRGRGLQRARKAAVLVEHVCDAAAHPGGEVPTGRAEDDDAAARHVLAAVVADAFDHGEAPQLRTAKRSPASPRMNAPPPVAP